MENFNTNPEINEIIIEDNKVILPQVLNANDIGFVSYENTKLSKESQDKLGLLFTGYEVNIEYNDYCTKEWLIENEIDFNKLNKEILSLTNSDESYYVSIHSKYEIINEDMKQFQINHKNIREDDMDERFIYTDYIKYSLVNDNKPLEVVLYENICSYIDSIRNVNGYFHKEEIDIAIEELNKLKKELNKGSN